MFPAIENDQQKTEYKRIFTTDYTEYLQLRDSIEADTSQHQQEYSALNEKLNNFPKRSEEASVRTQYSNMHCTNFCLYHTLQAIRKQIRAMYLEKQQNKRLVENQKRFKELHDKLGHIKKHVVDYDKSKTH